MKRWQIALIILGTAAFFATAAWMISIMRRQGLGHFPLPDITLTDRSGDPVKLASLRGEPLVLKIVSASCGRCVNDWSLLAERARATEGQYRVFAVVSGLSPAAAEHLLASAPRDLPALVDPGNQLTYALYLKGVPTYAFVSASGDLIALIWVSNPDSDLSNSQWDNYVSRMLAAG